MLNDWIFDPAGLSTPSGVPAVSRMNTGTSTVGPSAVAVPTVITSCATAAAEKARLKRTAKSRVFFMGRTSNLFAARGVPAPRSLARNVTGRSPSSDVLQTSPYGDERERGAQQDQH